MDCCWKRTTFKLNFVSKTSYIICFLIPYPPLKRNAKKYTNFFSHSGRKAIWIPTPASKSWSLHGNSYLVISDHQLPQRKLITVISSAERMTVFHFNRLIPANDPAHIKKDEDMKYPYYSAFHIAKYSNQNTFSEESGQAQTWILDNFWFISPLITTGTFLCLRKTS